MINKNPLYSTKISTQVCNNQCGKKMDIYICVCVCVHACVCVCMCEREIHFAVHQYKIVSQQYSNKTEKKNIDK